MTPEKVPYCGEVERRTETRLTEIQAILGNHGEALTGIREVLAVIRDKEHPCKEYGERISKLEKTKASLGGGWKAIAIVGGIIFGLGSLGGIVITTITLLK